LWQSVTKPQDGRKTLAILNTGGRNSGEYNPVPEEQPIHPTLIQHNSVIIKCS